MAEGRHRYCRFHGKSATRLPVRHHPRRLLLQVARSTVLQRGVDAHSDKLSAQYFLERATLMKLCVTRGLSFALENSTSS